MGNKPDVDIMILVAGVVLKKFLGKNESEFLLRTIDGVLSDKDSYNGIHNELEIFKAFGSNKNRIH